MKKTFGWVIALTALGASVAEAQVKLEAKFHEGSKSVLQSESKTTQTLTLAGMDIDTKSSTFLVTTYTTGKRGADGVLTVEEKTDVLQSELSLPGGITLQFDSANADKKADNPLLEPVLDIYRAMLRVPVTLVLDDKNKVTEIKLPDGELEKLSELAKERFAPETRKKAAEQANEFLPSEPVKPGDSWERTSDANFGSGQNMSFRTKYEYAGTVEQDGKTLDKITGKTFDVTYTVGPNAPFQVAKSELKVTDSTTTVLFDRQRGQMASLTSKVRIEGPLTMVINGTELPGKVDLTLESKSTRQK